MITSAVYVKQFSHYVSTTERPDTREFEDFDSCYKAMEIELDYKSKFQKAMFFDVDSKQKTILSELKAWRKFDKNQWRKVSIRQAERGLLEGASELRDFQHFLTRGELDVWIRGTLRHFGGKGVITAEGIVNRAINQQIRAITGLPTLDALRETNRFINQFTRGILDKESRELIEGKVRNFVFNGKQSTTVSEVISFMDKGLRGTIKKNLNKSGGLKLTNWLFDNIVNTDMWVDEQNLASGTITGLLKKKWTEFVRKKIFRTSGNRQIRRDDVFNVAIRVFENMKNDFLTTQNIFKYNVNRSLFKAINKEMSVLNLSANVRNNVRVFGRHAFRQGLLTLGLDPNDFSALERVVVNRLSRTSDKFVRNLTKKVLSKSLSTAQALVTSDKWSNRTLDKFFALGQLSGDRNGLYEWVYGDTHHCGTCMAAHGQRHRLRHWWDSGIIPRNHGTAELICHGFHCACRLVRVTGKAFGRLDRIPTAA